MAVIKITNPVIKTVKDGNGEDSRYLSMELVNPMYPNARPIKQNIFENRTGYEWFQAWVNNLPEERGGMWEPTDDEEWSISMVPTWARFMNNAETKTYKLDEPHFRKYGSDFAGHKEGEVVLNRQGKPKLVRSVSVIHIVQYKMEAKLDANGFPVIDPKTDMPIMTPVKDEHGLPIPEGEAAGWEADAAFENAMELLYPLSEWDGFSRNDDDDDDDEYEEENDVVEEKAPVATKRKPAGR